MHPQGGSEQDSYKSLQIGTTMKTGRALTEMAQVLETQQALKKDYVADTRALEMTSMGQLAISNDTTQTFDAD